MVVAVGVAVTLAPVEAERPVDGYQLYADPPVAANAWDAPAQMVALAVTPMEGVFTVTVIVPVDWHPDMF